MHFRIRPSNTCRDFNACAAAVADLYRRSVLTLGETTLSLGDVDAVERVRLGTGALLPNCDHHGQGLGLCP